MHSYISKTHGFRIYSDVQSFPLILPCFYSEFLSREHQDYNLSSSKKSNSIAEMDIVLRDISEELVDLYLMKLSSFLEWVENYSIELQSVNLSTHHNLPEDVINYYLNDYLIDIKAKGDISIGHHLAALKSYYSYLEATGFTNRKNLFIKPKFKESARNNTKRRSVVKYFTPQLRRTLVRFSNSKRDALLIRTASECGFRSMENQGLLLKDFKEGVNIKKGLLTLFAEMEKNEDKLEFTYCLKGIYSKGSRGTGGRTRDIFITRDLLQSMKDYWSEERPSSDSNHLFLNNSANDRSPISKSRGSKVFGKIRGRVLHAQKNGSLVCEHQALEENHTYHVLRHSFGTDLFYDLAEENNILIDAVTTTSQVYLTLAAVLGHVVTGKRASQTTARYIRSCNIKKSFESSELSYGL